VTNPQTLNATEAMVLRAIQTYFERNPYETKIQFVELIVDLDGRLVAGKLKSVVEHLIHLGCLWGSTSNSLELTARGLSSLAAVKLPSKDSFSHFCDLLLVALADHDKRIKMRNLDFGGFDLREVAKLYELTFSRGWVDRAGELFEHRKWASIQRVSSFGEDGGVFAQLTGPGRLEADAIRERLSSSNFALPTLPKPNNSEPIEASVVSSAGTAPTSAGGDLGVAPLNESARVPASDRLVSRADNAALFEDADKKLEAVIEAVRTTNDLQVTQEQRLAIISEIETTRFLLSKPVIRARAIYDATCDSAALKWLIAMAGAGIVGAKADAAVNALLALLGL